jgi:hypothetical protein
MAFASFIVYALTLFLALCALLKWAHRRNRLKRQYRQALSKALIVENEVGRPFLMC